VVLAGRIRLQHHKFVIGSHFPADKGILNQLQSFRRLLCNYKRHHIILTEDGGLNFILVAHQVTETC
jgi:hypothetical protein